MTKEFLSFETATLLGTWWGIIGFIIGPVFLFHNMTEYVDGSIAIFKANYRLRLEGRTVEQFAPKGQSEIKAIPDYLGVGASFGEIFVKPDVWRDINALHGYQVPEAVVKYEVAFARVAIIRETVKLGNAGAIAAKILDGIDQYVTEAFSPDSSEEITAYYKQVPLHIAAPAVIKSYEGNVFPLAELAFIFSRRLSIVSVPAIEIAALFDEVKAEAEALFRFATRSEP